MDSSPLTPTCTADATPELVVLLGDDCRPIGHMAKAEVHHATTPLHLAFSTYLFSAQGEVLLTRRAPTKVAWPGEWTNSACGHPAPGEDIAAAARRRLRQELGVDVPELTPILPDFAYRATDFAGTVENEVCPVFATRVPRDIALRPDPAEVMQTAWLPWADLTAVVAAAPVLISPWCVLQVQQLVAEGFDPTAPLPGVETGRDA